MYQHDLEELSAAIEAIKYSKAEMAAFKKLNQTKVGKGLSKLGIHQANKHQKMKDDAKRRKDEAIAKGIIDRIVDDMED